MSYIFNTILCFCTGEDTAAVVREANTFDDFWRDGDGFKIPPNDDWYGGVRGLEHRILVGAFNHLSVDGLLKHLAGYPWRSPECVQVMVKTQDDNRFQVWALSTKGNFVPEIPGPSERVEEES